MTSPVEQLLTSIQNLLQEGREDLGFPATFPVDGGISFHRGDAPTEAAVPLLAVCQAGGAKERHKQGSGLWEIPISARLVLDRNGECGDTPEEVAATVRSFADDLEGALTMPALKIAYDQDGGISTPEERMSDENVFVWEIFDVEVAEDNELEGDPVCEVTFTAFCCHASKIIPESP